MPPVFCYSPLLKFSPRSWSLSRFMPSLSTPSKCKSKYLEQGSTSENRWHLPFWVWMISFNMVWNLASNFVSLLLTAISTQITFLLNVQGLMDVSTASNAWPLSIYVITDVQVSLTLEILGRCPEAPRATSHERFISSFLNLHSAAGCIPTSSE